MASEQEQPMQNSTQASPPSPSASFITLNESEIFQAVRMASWGSGEHGMDVGSPIPLDLAALTLGGQEHESIGRERATGAVGRVQDVAPHSHPAVMNEEAVQEADLPPFPLDDVNVPSSVRLLGEAALFNFVDDNDDNDNDDHHHEEIFGFEGNNGLEAIPELPRFHARLFAAQLLLIGSVMAIGFGALYRLR